MECLRTPITGDVSVHYVNATLGKPQLPGGGSQPAPAQQVQQARALAAKASHTPKMRQPVTFADLPPEIREMIWWYALPESRVFNALVYASVGLKMQLLERASLRLPLAHVCFESREAVRRAGYKLAFRDEDEPEDPGVWFHPRKDVIERTIWGPGDFWGMR